MNGYRKKSRRTGRIVGVVIIVVTIWVVRSVLNAPPGDARLNRQFKENRATLEELKVMLTTNSPGEVIRPDMAVQTVEDHNRYKALMRQAGVIQSMRVGNDYRFQVAGKPYAKKGFRIDIIWTESKPDRVIASIDDFRKTSTATEHAYRIVDTNWYLWITK